MIIKEMFICEHCNHPILPFTGVVITKAQAITYSIEDSPDVVSKVAVHTGCKKYTSS
jgi:hypothetical protein